MQIFKFTLEKQTHQIIEMPLGAKVLDVQIQNNEIVLWAICDASRNAVERRFRILFTGDDVLDLTEDSHAYLGTVQDRHLVWHIFEEL